MPLLHNNVIFDHKIVPFSPVYPHSLSNISESIRDSPEISTACKNSDISLSETL